MSCICNNKNDDEAKTSTERLTSAEVSRSYEVKPSVDIKVPARAEYVSVVRLTASGVASRMGFDIEQIEDIKVAVAEVCNRAVLMDESGEGTCYLRFIISDDNLTVVFNSSKINIHDLFRDDEGLGLSLINALMDEVNVCPDGEQTLEMVKII